MTARLECRGLSCGHDYLTVVHSMDLTVGAGEVVALLGPNGAGKTTLLETLSGLLPSHGGEVLVDGDPLDDGSPARVNRSGVVLVPDDRALFTSLTVRENIEVARSESAAPAESVLEVFPALESRWKVRAGALSGGEQQMLALARAMIQRPRVLLIDEMSMGLAPIIVESLVPVVRQVALGTDAAVVVVEQHVQLVLEMADRAVVLVKGEVTHNSPAAELGSDPERILAAYMARQRHVRDSGC